MTAQDQVNRISLIQETDVLSARLSEDQKEMINRHVRRLRKIHDTTDDNAIALYTSRTSAVRQLAAMTIVFRSYMSKCEPGHPVDNFEEGESMVAEVIDASFHTDESTHTWSSPAIACTNPIVFGRLQEYEALVQAQQAESVDDVTELWNIQPYDKVVPDSRAFGDVGEAVEWKDHLREYASDGEPVNSLNKDVGAEERLKAFRELKEKAEKQEARRDLDRTWPPPKGKKGKGGRGKRSKAVSSGAKHPLG